MDSIEIRLFGRADAAAYRELRLEGLERHPDAFGSSAEEERPRSLEDIASRITGGPPDATFGAFEGERAVGMAGFYARPSMKTRHRGVLWGVYVRPAWRGSGLGERLVRRVIEHARAESTEILELTVSAGNRPAAALYERLGFIPYGIQEDALKLGDRYVAEEFWALRL